MSVVRAPLAIAALCACTSQQHRGAPRVVAETATGDLAPPLRVVVQQGLLGVSAMAVHPHGPFAVIATRDHVAKLWHLGAQREVLTMIGHTDKLLDVAISPDGGWIATVAQDSTLRLWSWGSDRPSRTIAITNPRFDWPADAMHVAFSPDGQRVIAALEGDSLAAWDATTGSLLWTLKQVGSRALTVMLDGTIAVGGRDGKVHLVDRDGTAVLTTVDAHAKQVFALIGMRDGKTLVSTGDDGVKVWDVADVTAVHLVRQLDGAQAAVYALALPPEDHELIAADWLGNMLAWDVADGRMLARVPTEISLDLGGAEAMIVDPVTRRALVGTTDGNLATWDYADSQRVIEVSHTETNIVHAAYDQKHGLLATSDGSTVQVYRMEDASVVMAIPAAAGRLAFGGDKLVVELPLGGMLIGDLVRRSSLEIRGPALSNMVVSPDGSLIAGSTFGAASLVWRIADGALVANLPASGLSCLAFSGDGARLLTGGFGVPVSSWRVADGRRLTTYQPGQTPPRADTEEPAIVVPLVDPTLASADACAFVSDDRLVAIAGFDGAVRLFDADTAAPSRTLPGNGAPVSAIAELRPGALLTGGRDAQIRWWDVETGETRATYTGHASGIGAIMIVPGGLGFLSVSSDRTIREWRTDRTTPELTFIPLSLRDGPGLTPRAANVTLDRAGNFDFSAADGLEFVHVVRGMDVISLNQLVDVFYRPQLVARRRRGQATTAEIDRSAGLRLPPAVTLAAERQGARIHVRAEARVQDGGLTEWMLFQNSRLVARATPATAPPAGTAIAQSWDVAERPGRNRLLVVARSVDGIKSYSPTIDVANDRANITPRQMHIVTVGIDHYGTAQVARGRGGDDGLIQTNRGLFVGDLAHASDDARDVERQLRAVATPAFDLVRSTVLIDGQASREAILGALGHVASVVDGNDTVVVFLAGHGLSARERVGRLSRTIYRFVPSDYGSVDRLATTGLSSDDLLAALGAIPSGDVVLVLDTCESGASSDAFAADVFGTLRVFGEESGVHVVASAAVNQDALELSNLGHGAFTYALLDRLTCGREPLSLRALAEGTERKLTELLRAGGRQSVVVSSSGRDPVIGCR